MEILPPFANAVVKEAYEEFTRFRKAMDALMIQDASVKDMANTLANEIAVQGEQLTFRQNHGNRIQVTRNDAGRLRNESSHLHALILSAGEQLIISKESCESLQEAFQTKFSDLSDWIQKLKERVSDENELRKYSRTDSRKLSELRRQVEGWSEERNKKTSLCQFTQQQVTDSRSEIDNIMRTLRSKTDMKHGLSKMIQTNLVDISEADSTIERLSRQYAGTTERTNRNQKQVAALKAQVHLARNECASYRKQQEDATKQIATAKQTIREKDVELEQVLGGLSFDKSAIRSHRVELERTEGQLDAMIKDVEMSRSGLTGLERKLHAEIERCESISGGKETKELEAREAKKVVEDLFALVGECEVDIQNIKQSMLLEAGQLESMRDKGRAIQNEFSGTNSAMNRINRGLAKLSEDEEKLRDRALSLQVEIEKVSFRLSSLVGQVSSDSEKERLKNQLRDLEEQLKEIRSAQSTLGNEVRRYGVEIKMKERSIEGIKQDVINASQIQRDLETEVEAIEREVKEVKDEQNRLLVVRDELTAQTGQKRNELESKISVFVEKRNSQLERESRLRDERLAATAEVQKLQQTNKELHEQRHLLAIRIGDVRNRISQLQVSYDHLVRQRLGADEDDVHSQANMVVKAAQERQSLLDYADALSLEIQNENQELETLQAAMASIRQPKPKDSVFGKLDTIRKELVSNLNVITDEGERNRLKVEFVSDSIQAIKQLLLHVE